MTLTGINLSGAEFGSVGGTYGIDYIYPGKESIDYYASKGMDVIRLPFLWERVQPTRGGPLDTAELARIDQVVDYATSKGLKVVLDVHNYGWAYGSLVGSAALPHASFADLWGKLATHFIGNTNVMFGLMNEPHDQSATQWIESANAAIGAIRGAGATQQILVPGTYWDGAHSWVSSDNSTVVGGGVVDPLHNFSFEVHQYLDIDSSGTSPNVVSPTIGVERLTEITNWAHSTGNTLFLGEFGAAQDSASLTALDNMMAYMHQNADVWSDATYWSGGPWWGDYMFSVEPSNLASPVDKPQMGILEKYAHSTASPATTAPLSTTNTGNPVDAALSSPVVTEALAYDTGISPPTDTITSDATLTGTADPNSTAKFTVGDQAIAAAATTDASEAGDSVSIYHGNKWSGFATTGADGTFSYTTNASAGMHTYGANATGPSGEGHGIGKAILDSTGTDTLVGSSGNVTFKYTAAAESTAAAADVITDFRHGADNIDFTTIAGINASNGVPTFEGYLPGTGNMTLNAHSVAVMEVGGGTQVLVNTSNAAETVTPTDMHAADMMITLLGVNLGITGTDFH